MFDVTLLSTKDKEQWLEILSRFDRKDPCYLAEYVEVYEKYENRESYLHFGGRGMLFVYGDSRNFIIYPFFKRNLCDLPFVEPSIDNLFDIVSPYGYGGPLAQVEDEVVSEELWRGFFNEFNTFCRQNNIVSEFSRLHPMFDNSQLVSKFSHGYIEKRGRIVYIDLTRSEEDIHNGMNRRRRRGLRKGKRNPKLQVFSTLEPEYAFLFATLYKETMARKRADIKFLFPSDFFERAFRLLVDHLTLSCVAYQGELISAVLTLNYGDLCYDWLSGSKAEYHHLFPNDMCIYQSIVEARKNGCKTLVLGGGASGEDSLFRFKAEFSELFKDFYVYKKIHLEEEYRELVRLRNRYTKEPAGDFFPEYRSYRMG